MPSTKPTVADLLQHTLNCFKGASHYMRQRPALQETTYIDSAVLAVVDGLATVQVVLEQLSALAAQQATHGAGTQPSKPIPVLLWCPECHTRHVDVGEWAIKPHHTHACQQCGFMWRPTLVHTVGVEFLPGCKNGGAL